MSLQIKLKNEKRVYVYVCLKKKVLHFSLELIIRNQKAELSGTV